MKMIITNSCYHNAELTDLLRVLRQNGLPLAKWKPLIKMFPLDKAENYNIIICFDTKRRELVTLRFDNRK